MLGRRSAGQLARLLSKDAIARRIDRWMVQRPVQAPRPAKNARVPEWRADRKRKAESFALSVGLANMGSRCCPILLLFRPLTRQASALWCFSCCSPFRYVIVAFHAELGTRLLLYLACTAAGASTPPWFSTTHHALLALLPPGERFLLTLRLPHTCLQQQLLLSYVLSVVKARKSLLLFGRKTIGRDLRTRHRKHQSSIARLDPPLRPLQTMSDVTLLTFTL